MSRSNQLRWLTSCGGFLLHSGDTRFSRGSISFIHLWKASKSTTKNRRLKRPPTQSRPPTRMYYWGSQYLSYGLKLAGGVLGAPLVNYPSPLRVRNKSDPQKIRRRWFPPEIFLIFSIICVFLVHRLLFGWFVSPVHSFTMQSPSYMALWPRRKVYYIAVGLTITSILLLLLYGGPSLSMSGIASTTSA
jgi:hypothetical protein